MADEWGAWPGDPISPATDEYTLKYSSTAEEEMACNDLAPCTLGPKAARKLVIFWLLSMASASWCAAWNTPLKRSPPPTRRRMVAAMPPSSDESHRMRWTSAAHSASQLQSSSLPATTRSLREDSTSFFAPASTRSRAVSKPSPPSPPEKKWAPSATLAGALGPVDLGVCATTTACPLRKLSPRMQWLPRKPFSARSDCHCGQLSSGESCPIRSASSNMLKSHQPSVMPNVICTNAIVQRASLTASMPPGLSSCEQW